MDKIVWVVLFCAIQSVLCQDDCRFATGSCSIEGQVCIVQTSTIDADNSGRVQICRDGVWGTISDRGFSTWSEKNAQVACKQAGFTGAINSIIPTTILSSSDRAPSSVPVHYTDVSCSGSESTVLDCLFSTDVSAFELTPGQFTHVADAFVVCRPNTNSGDYSSVHVEGPLVGDLRLYGDMLNGRGAVEIFTNEFGWSSICPDDFDNLDAAVICRQFGYTTGSADSDTISSEQSPSTRYLFNTECSDSGPDSTDLDLTTVTAGKCTFTRGFGTCPSSSSSYAKVQCLSSISFSDGSIRLFGGTRSNAGIVEVFYNDKWGMVCTNGQFTLSAARAVCHQLGFDEDEAQAMSALSLIDEESPMKPIWYRMLDAECSSGDSFTDCVEFDPVGYGACNPSSSRNTIAAVSCGDSVEGGLSSGGITGIVFAIIFVLFFLIPLVYYFGIDYWKKRHTYDWYNTLTTPSSWCDCCTGPTQRRTFQLERTTPRQLEEITLEEPTQPPVEFGGFRTRNESSSSSSNESEAPISTEPQEPSFTKAPPPTYNASDNFPSVAPPANDLPPPYPGPGGPLPPVGFAFAPPTSSGASAPPPNAGYPDPAYPPPPETVEASAPPPSSGYPDPAYPPPVLDASAPGYPVDTQPGGELPYPVNLEYGGGAYPPPTVHEEPSS